MENNGIFKNREDAAEEYAKQFDSECRERAEEDFLNGYDFCSRWYDAKEITPPKKDGWNHSEQVLVEYESTGDKVAGYGIAHYNYDPPFANPQFIDFANYGRQPFRWMFIPQPMEMP